MARPRPFRVIIIGGGLVGLTAAHVFSKAGIEFLVLEKHDTLFSTRGSTLALWPQSFRIFDQLGLLDAVQPILDRAETVFIMSVENAQIWTKDKTPDLIEKNHGYGIRITHRPEMVKFLYESLPDVAKAQILPNKTATNIVISEQGVTVFCGDGTSHEGSIVIGADGVRSHTRLLMRAIQDRKQPDNLSEVHKSPYIATYRVYFGVCPVLAGLAANARYDGAGDGVSTQIVNGTNRAWFGLYEKLDNPTSQRRRYGDADKEAIIRRWGSLYMAPGWKFRDVNEYRIGETGLIDLEEGLIDKWFHHRIVLVGDAVRKLEPHAGLGYNSGITDLVVLVNGLRHLLQVNESPTAQELDELFRTYQTEREVDSQEMAKISMRSARILAWPTWRYKMLATYAQPYLPLTKFNINYTLGPLISRTPVLEWIDEGPIPTSVIPWRSHPGPQAKGNTIKEVRFPILQSIAVLVVTLLIASLFGQVGSKGRE